MSMHRVVGAFLFCMIGGCAVGCSSENAASPPDAAPVEDSGTTEAATDGGEDANFDPASALAWTPCSIGIPWPERKAECATVEMPLDWSNPTGKKIGIRVRRALSPTRPATGQVWVLTGGPGQAGVIIPLTDEGSGTTMDVYSIDFRGTGQSDAFVCAPLQSLAAWLQADAVSAAEACVNSLHAKYGDDLKHFSTTNDARDVAEMMRRTGTAATRRIVVGISYGTIRAGRLTQVAPELLTGVLIDSVASPQRSWIRANMTRDALAKKVIEACVKDNAYCASKMGADASARLASVASKLAAGHCKTSRNFTARDYRRLFTVMLASSSKVHFPAVIHRFERCDPADEAALIKLVDKMNPFERVLPSELNPALHLQIVLNEYVRDTDPTIAEIEAAETASVASGQEGAGYRAVAAIWKRYPVDALSGTLAKSTVPVLAISGELDSLTPVEEANEVFAAWGGTHKTQVILPRGSHSVFPSMPCAREVADWFFADPTKPIDTSCAKTVPAIPWRGLPSLAMSYFGTTDTWENP